MEKFERNEKNEEVEVKEVSGVRKRSDLLKTQELRSADERATAAKLHELASEISVAGEDEEEQIAKIPAMLTEQRQGLMARLVKKAKKHKFAVALLAAMGVHYPITPQGQAVTDRIVEAVKGAKTVWETKNMVIHPQSDEEKESVKAKIFERGARADAAGQVRFKAEMDQRLDSGEEVRLSQEYFGLAKLNGEDPARVKEAEAKKEELVDRLADRMGDEMSEVFIRSVVDEMFGSSENYVWGQASVTEYFLTGKRNCVSIARAEQMVFEELIVRLPEKERSKYQIGQAFEKQQEIATVTILNADGSVNSTLYLQPPVRTLVGAIEETGAPVITLSKIKKAIVSPKPVNVKSTVKAGEVVADSPDIESLSNDPVALNIKIQGPLRGSDYVRTIAEERNIVPVKAVPEKLVGVQELEIGVDDKAEARRLDAAAAQAIVELYKLQRDNHWSLPSSLRIDDLYDPLQLDTLDISTNFDFEKLEFRKVTISLDRATKERIFKLPTRELWFDTCNADSMASYHALVQYVAGLPKEKQITAPLLGLNVDSITDLEPYDFGTIERIGFKVDPNPNKAVQAKELNALFNFPANEVFLQGSLLRELDKDWLKKMSESSKVFRIESAAYLYILLDYPEAAEWDNVKPWVNDVVEESLWNDVMKKGGSSGSAKFRQKMRGILADGRAKFGAGWYTKDIY